MTGYINYLDRKPDDRLLRLQEVWEQLCESGKLPAYTTSVLTEFPQAVDRASLIVLIGENPAVSHMSFVSMPHPMRRLREAHIGRFKPLADFDWAWPRQIDHPHQRL